MSTIPGQGHWEWWLTFRAAVETARRAVDAAASVLDHGLTNLLDRNSTKINRALNDAEGSTNLRMSCGRNPLSYPPAVVDEMIRAATAVKDWTESLRTTAMSEGMPSVATPAPSMERPVRIAEAATAANMRSDLLLKRLRTRAYPVSGVKGAYEADLSHVILVLPRKKRRQVQEWADK